MFRVRLRGIVREPQRLQDYAQNAQLVIDAKKGETNLKCKP